MTQEYQILFSPYKMGGLSLKNRVVMAPMTRSRAIGNVTNEMVVKYYRQRAEAGLLVTEGTSPSPNGLGYCRIPGLYNPQQVAAWKEVTDAVHANGGKIFVQLMHTGRIAHPLNLPEGAKMVAPSAIAAPGQMYTDAQGMQNHPVPEEIPGNEIAAVIAEFVHSSRCAIEAGFDGVEIHAANGYLPMQFLNAASNQRMDQYGGGHENRNRFVLELAEAVSAAIGKEKTGIRLSPFSTSGGALPGEDEIAQYIALADGLGKLDLVYLHLLAFAMPAGMADNIHKAFGGTLILNGGYTAARAEADLEAGKAELISFGRPFISNPDLVQRIGKNVDLANPDPSTFFSAGEKGYIDYPVFAG